MIPGNYEAVSNRCFVAGAFTSSVVGSPQDWAWVNEAKGSLRPKWVYVSTAPGSALRLKVDTRATAAVDDDPEAEKGAGHDKVGDSERGRATNERGGGGTREKDG